ncbi:UDP-N-acetylmuramoyl-L-alanyl-D-glutamate--2,6-diaminopimelate ligase [Candidatus Gracilibacteria bacterium]|nr:MAG: UDP-N-acetylmuramoyl-L-alanyl-D-glutamate--2,6-diaminopimelate ligase [Candidatus Gracilibacteria bacterium]PIE85002.1 MAG: UDP-N-acetylmuramoyl-L-alanyl-D-glutamate--2,6-diaminopimelate ligase [Candidatus Gracilibacteria bacterium]
MKVKQKFKKMFALDNPFRLGYHKIRAIIANFVYSFPSKDMQIIGVTGTNGKTTTCNIIASGLRKAGKKVFMFTTVNIIIGDEEYLNETKMTSPDVFELQKLFSIAKKAGCEVAIIETASHGIVMHRVWGLEYDTCVLTNITQDHLDLHRTMENYVNTKLSIFKNLIRYKRKPGIKKTAVINIDSDYSELFLAETYDTFYTYGKNARANFAPYDIETTINGTKFKIRMAGKDINVDTHLLGDFNVYNILAAIGVFVSSGMKQEEIEDSIKDVLGIPGRMEKVENSFGFTVIVDYAHTEDALRESLSTIKGMKGLDRIITVFGATGDRDKTKRPIMGEVVSELSDVVILTQDDDYTEKTENIIKDILPGIERKEGDNFWIIANRKEAIRTALMSAEKGDVVFLAGKGDEHIMITNKGPIQWHDKTIVKEILKGIEDNTLVK